MPSAAAIYLCLNLIAATLGVELLVTPPTNMLRSAAALILIMINGLLAGWNVWGLVSP